MNGFRAVAFSFAALWLSMAALLAPQTAAAQATRTWVSGVGDDVNPCSRTAPCRTFAGAISKTAANGEINCTDPGGFGSVNITKSITIDCTGVMAGVSNPGTTGLTINAPGGQVALRNLAIGGAGSGTAGVRVVAAANVVIDKVVIQGQSGNGIDVIPAAGATVSVTDSLVRGNGQHGVWVAPTSGSAARVTVARSTFAGNGFTGIRLNENSTATVSDSALSGNGTSGASVSGAASTMSLDRVNSSGNRDGGVLAKGAGAVMWLSNVQMSGNSYGFFPPGAGGTYVSFGNNRVVGNVVSDGVPTQVITEL